MIEHGWVASGATCAADVNPCGDESGECFFCGNLTASQTWTLDGDRCCRRVGCVRDRQESDIHTMAATLQLALDGHPHWRSMAAKLLAKWRGK